MRLKAILILTLAFIAIFSSCKKDNENNYENLDDFFDDFKVESQYYSFSPDEDYSFTSNSGTHYTFFGSTFEREDGEPITGDIDIELREFYTVQQMMFEGVLTVSHTRQILESAGFFYIRTTNNDSKATGKIGISIPTNTINNEMQTFSLFTDSVPQAWLLSGDSIGYPDPDALDSLYYYIEFINDYEWINCDDFIEGPQSDFTVNIYKNPTLYYTNVYFIFDEINSITEFSHYSQDVFKHYMLPVGYTGKLFAIAYYDGQGHYYLEEMTIPEEIEMEITLEAVDDDELIDVLNSL